MPLEGSISSVKRTSYISLLLKQRQLQYFSIAKPYNKKPDNHGLTFGGSANGVGELVILLPSELKLFPEENAFVVHKSYLDDLSAFGIPFHLNVVGNIRIRPEPFARRADIIQPAPELDDWFYGYGNGLQILMFQAQMHKSITSWIQQAFLNHTPVNHVEKFAESSIFKFQESVWDTVPRTVLTQFIRNSKGQQENTWLFDDYDYLYDELKIAQIAEAINFKYSNMEDLIDRLTFPVGKEQ